MHENWQFAQNRRVNHPVLSFFAKMMRFAQFFSGKFENFGNLTCVKHLTNFMSVMNVPTCGDANDQYQYNFWYLHQYQYQTSTQHAMTMMMLTSGGKLPANDHSPGQFWLIRPPPCHRLSPLPNKYHQKYPKSRFKTPLCCFMCPIISNISRLLHIHSALSQTKTSSIPTINVCGEISLSGG